MNSDSSSPSLMPGWRSIDDDLRAFSKKHAECAFVSTDPLYVLPKGLRDALRDEVPGWFTEPELAFEHDLETICTEHNALGFFLGRAILDPYLTPVPSIELSEGDFVAMGCDKFSALSKMRAVLGTSLDETSEAIHHRLDAYRGWLLTNPVFHGELEQLKNRWGPMILELGTMPTYPIRVEKSSIDEPPPDGRDVTSEFVAEWNSFFERWELQGFITWDLPVPTPPNLSGLALPRSVARPPSQITINVPVTMSPLGLTSIIDEAQRTQRPEHLRDWGKVIDQKHPRGLRFHSFRQIFLLKFYRDTVLAGRYAIRFGHRIQAVDRAFGEFLGGLDERDKSLGEDSIKKLRQHMNALSQAKSQTC